MNSEHSQSASPTKADELQPAYSMGRSSQQTRLRLRLTELGEPQLEQASGVKVSALPADRDVEVGAGCAAGPAA